MLYHQHRRKHRNSVHTCDTQFHFKNLNSSPSVYTANNTGDSIPPCLTPFMTVKDSDITLPHLTLNAWFVYIDNNNRKTKGDISRFNNSLKSLQ